INNLITDTYQRPLFNYINFWKYLNLFLIESIIYSKNIEEFKMSILRNEMLKLFINRNTKYVRLYIPQSYRYQLHHIPEVECCLSELEFFYCSVNINQDILEGLSRICKSIKRLIFDSLNHCTNNSGIIKLIEVQKNLNDVRFIDYQIG